MDPTIQRNGVNSHFERLIRIPWRISRAERLSNRISFRLFKSYWRRNNLAPDKYAKWRQQVIRTLSDDFRANRYKPDVVLTFAQPFTDHLIGLELKRLFGYRWIAHFSDPWVDNVYNRYDARTREINSELERAVVSAADLCIFTSNETVDLVFRKYPHEIRRKVRVLPHCFDPFLFDSGIMPTNAKLITRYLGNFYGHRTPFPLIKALLKLAEREPSQVSDVQIELIGQHENTNEFRDDVSSLPAGTLISRKPVDYRTSLRLMMESDGLIVIDAPDDRSVFLPSKLIDYVGAGRPLLGITPEGAAADLIMRLGGYVAAPTDLESVVETIKLFFDVLRRRRLNNDLSVWGSSEERSKYEVKTVSNEFTEMLFEVAGVA